MSREQNLGGLDRFRFFAAFLVIAIHISPLSAISREADFFLTRVLARLAVPFFFLVTGYFVLGDRPEPARLRRFLLRTGLLYGLSIILYLPFGIYAGHYRELTAGGLFRMVFFDGTFYHLWYFPACLLGILLVLALKRCPYGFVPALAAGFLYLLGLAGDSYYGLTASVPFLKAFYEGFFRISSYTRNGLFFAPLFLVLGSWLASGKARPDPGRRLPALAGFVVSFALMTLEAYLLRSLGLPRHDSMYLFLAPSMFFLFRLLLSAGCRPAKRLRTVSSWIYVLHPALLIVLRAAAKPLHLTWLLVDRPFIQFLSVSAVTAGVSFAVSALLPKGSWILRSLAGNKAFPTGRKASSAPSAPPFGRRAWIELDRSALCHNVNYLKKLLPAGCRLMPAVKANAYGHGAVLISRELNRLGIDAFCVACAAEGVILRKHGVTGEILILGYTHPSQFPLLNRFRLTQTVVDASYGALLNASGRDFHVHVGIDTGMRRLGEPCENLDGLSGLWKLKHLRIDGVFSHLCTADGQTDREEAYVKKQISAFQSAVRRLEARGCPCPGIHLLSSFGLLRYPAPSAGYVRPGIALYGLLSTEADTAAWGGSLKPVLSLKARIAAVKHLKPGESAGYGLMHTAGKEETLAVLSIGYADGLPRSFSCGKGFVLLEGRRAPIAGRICMDQTLVDATGIPGVKAGGYAVLIGSWGEEEITACGWAEAAGTITNEILSRLGGRLERMYARDEEGK